MNTLLRFYTDESGATAMEYALIAALISVAIIAGVNLTGESVETLYDSISSKVSIALGSASQSWSLQGASRMHEDWLWISHKVEYGVDWALPEHLRKHFCAHRKLLE